MAAGFGPWRQATHTLGTSRKPYLGATCRQQRLHVYTLSICHVMKADSGPLDPACARFIGAPIPSQRTTLRRSQNGDTKATGHNGVKCRYGNEVQRRARGKFNANVNSQDRSSAASEIFLCSRQISAMSLGTGRHMSVFCGVVAELFASSYW